MSYQAYIPGDDFGRVCDVCGRLRPGRGFRVVDNVWICDRHPSYVPHQTLDKVPYRSLGAPVTIPSAKPWNPIDTYEIPEAQLLNLVTAYAPAETLDVTNGAGVPITTPGSRWQSAAWTCLYLYDLIAENKRPARWLTLARTVLGILGDYLYTGMKGGPAGGAFTNVDLPWGAFNRDDAGGSEIYASEDSGAAGLALLRAYQVLGAAKYLTGARACAWFLRSAQCGDKLIYRPSSTDAAGASVKHFGVWSHSITSMGGPYDFDHRYYPGDLIALEFLAAFRAAAGDEVIGSATTTAVFNASRAATVSTAISEALTFWTTATWSVDDGALVNGLSSGTPREFFDAYPAVKFGITGRGSWQFANASLPGGGTLITSRGWAMALRALRALSGDGAVTGLFDWLMTFAPNAIYGETAHTPLLFNGISYVIPNERAFWATAGGNYNPRVALATLLQVRSGGSPVHRNGSSFYDLATAGLLAPLYSARQQATFGQLKDALEVPRPRWREGCEPRDGQMLWLGPLGICGLSFQPYTDAVLNRYQSITRAAQLGGIYRYAPQAWTGKGH